ncbi:unnamed protein product, partial [Ectocarpus sp. 4 AP-2014]
MYVYPLPVIERIITFGILAACLIKTMANTLPQIETSHIATIKPNNTCTPSYCWCFCWVLQCFIAELYNARREAQETLAGMINYTHKPKVKKRSTRERHHLHRHGHVLGVS